MDESISQYYDLINQQQQMNNAWSAEQAKKAMDYQTEMSNTAHQREVADLKAAGLNPVLSAGGQGATTGSGHAAQAGNENVTALYGLISKAMDAQLEQAKAMNNTAKAKFSSGSGYGSTASSNGNLDWWSDSGYVNAIEDMLYRMFGIKQETTDQVIDDTAKIVKSLKEKLGYIPKALGNFLLWDPAKHTSGREFFEADKDRNGYLSQKEFAQFKYENGHVPGSRSNKDLFNEEWNRMKKFSPFKSKLVSDRKSVYTRGSGSAKQINYYVNKSNLHNI